MIFALLAVCLVLAAGVILLVIAVCHFGEEIAHLRRRLDAATDRLTADADALAGARSDRARLVDVEAENNRLLSEVHEVTVRCARAEKTIARFIPADLLPEEAS